MRLLFVGNSNEELTTLMIVVAPWEYKYRPVGSSCYYIQVTFEIFHAACKE